MAEMGIYSLLCVKGSSCVNNNSNCNTSMAPVVIIDHSNTDAQQTKS